MTMAQTLRQEGIEEVIKKVKNPPPLRFAQKLSKKEE